MNHNQIGNKDLSLANVLRGKFRHSGFSFHDLRYETCAQTSETV